MEGKKIFKFASAAAFIILGLLLNIFDIGSGPYLGFASVGSWLIYAGFVAVAVSILPMLRKKERLVDERMLAVAAKANRVMFLAVIVFAFIIMIIDGINPIDVQLGMFMAYLVTGMMAVYFVSYRILLKYN